MYVYQKDIDQFKAGEAWSLTGSDGEYKGGHGVYLCGYDEDGLTCMTWGKKQRMTWDFWDARIDEAYGIVDNRDEWLGEDSPVDVEKLDAYLQEITEGRGEGSTCPVANGIVWILNKCAGLIDSSTRIPKPIKIRRGE
jgi:hypothetical protein